MDGDPSVEPELDSFSLTLPLPYRIALVIVLGVWAWGVNLHYLSFAKIDVPSLLHYPPRPSPRLDPPHHLSTYRLATVLTIPLTLSLLLFWTLSHRSPALVIHYDYLPMLYLLLLFTIFILPIRRFSPSGRSRFLSTLRRISLGGLAPSNNGKFGDILLADVLTSYAKIIADIFVSLCMFFSSSTGSATARPDRGCGGEYLVPIIIAIPSMIRLRQCLIEYVRVRKQAPLTRTGKEGWGGQHLANALKYFSAFPVIVLSALQRNVSAEEGTHVSSATLYRLWVLAVTVNSLYSFYWDVAKDWDLTLFSSLYSLFSPSSSSSQSQAQPHPFGLRPRTTFPESLYYYAITLDLLLRFTWSVKLSPHLDHFSSFESSIFLLECLEVGRRWIWIFFRVETEWVRSLGSGNGRGEGLLGQEEILLGEYGNGEYRNDSGKDDDD